VDKKIRGMIKKELKIKGLSIECHQALWRDGGISYSSLRDRGDVLTIQSFAQMTLPGDIRVRVAMRQFIEDEPEFRRIETEPNAQFLDWKEGKDTRTGTSIIIKKTRRTSKNQNVEQNLEGAFMVIKANGSEKKINILSTSAVILPRQSCNYGRLKSY
jgi:hypothetical protein